MYTYIPNGVDKRSSPNLLENIPRKKVLKTEKVFCHIYCYCAQNFYLMTLVHNPSANFQNLMVQSSEPLIQYCSLCDRIMHLTLLLWPNLDKFNFRIYMIRIFFGESDKVNDNGSYQKTTWATFLMEHGTSQCRGDHMNTEYVDYCAVAR